MLRKSPGFTLVVVLTLALGIGANTAIFSVVNGVLLRPLPYEESGDLVSLYTRYLPATGYDFPYFPLSGPEYLDVREGVAAFDDAAAYTYETSNLASGSGEPQRVLGVQASGHVFDLLGSRPAFGRTFAPGEDALGGPCVTVLSYGLWRELWGGDPAAVGRDLRLDGAPCRVIGVMPKGFVFPLSDVRLWTPLRLDPTSPTWGRASHPYSAVARLRRGGSLAEAEAELEGLYARWSADFPEHYAGGHYVVLRSLHDDIVGDVRPALLVLLAAVGFVLLMMCVNLATLLLSRAESRRREVAVRAALGAGRGRIVRQLLTESLVLALAGGALGVLLTVWLLHALIGLYPDGLPRADEIAVDGVVLLFTCGVSVLTGVAFGLLPAFQGSGLRLQEALKAEGRSSMGHRTSTRIRRALVVAEVALSLMLVVGAMLLVRSYVELRRLNLGFEPAGVLTFGVEPTQAGYPDPGQVRQFFAELHARLAALRGVESVGEISNLPLVSAGPADNFIIEGRPLPEGDQPGWNARYLIVGPGAFETLRMRLRRGRLLEEGDVAGRQLVAVINETAARSYWPNEDAVGRRIRYGEDGPWITIVGVVADVRSLSLAEAAPPAIYVAHAQAARPTYPGRFMTVVLRARGDPQVLVPAARAAVAELDPTLPLADVRSMQQIVDLAAGGPRFTMTLMMAFAALGLLLGALGIYGVLAYAVQRRLQEIGVRVALGASSRDVLRLVVGQGMALAACGVVVGSVAAFGLTRFLSSLLFGVGATDPLSFATVALVLLTVSFAASWLPARRAVAVDPMTALRAQ